MGSWAFAISDWTVVVECVTERQAIASGRYRLPHLKRSSFRGRNVLAAMVPVRYHSSSLESEVKAANHKPGVRGTGEAVRRGGGRQSQRIRAAFAGSRVPGDKG